MKLDYKEIDDIELDGIDMRDYPKFCDAYILSADYQGRAMTKQELDVLNEDMEFILEAVENHIH